MRMTALLLLLFAAAPVHAVTLGEIPSPRPAGWSVDLTGRISPTALLQINRLGDEVRAKTGAEIAVVVVGSVDGADSHDFATRLFNAWGVGDRTRNDGVLVLAALDDHKAEIVLGSGIDNEQSRRTSREIMQSEMIPRFRSDDPAAAVLAGAQACARRILDVQIAQIAETAPQPLLARAPESVVPRTAVPQTPAKPVETRSDWEDPVLFLFLLFMLGLVVLLIFIFARTGRASSSSSWKESSWDASSSLLSSSGSSSYDSGSSSSSSDSGFSGGHSDGGGASGQW